MVLKKAPLLWAQKSIYILLILWVGGLAPLIVMENFSSHQGVQSVQISLLKKPGSAQLPPAVRQMLTQGGRQWPTDELNLQPQLVVRHFALPEITSALKVFHDNFWLYRMSLIGFIDAVPWEKVFSIQLTEYSVDLPPPEKPPPFLPRLIVL
jgi:hypothetical protein